MLIKTSTTVAEAEATEMRGIVQKASMAGKAQTGEYKPKNPIIRQFRKKFLFFFFWFFRMLRGAF